MLETSTEGVLECPDCGGEGVLLEQGAPGLFWDREQSFFPSERLVPCSRCSGAGGLGGCARCGEPWQLRDGLEVCACAHLAWPAAA